ncbi:hypothetical protein [Streptomonospora halophila]
MDQDVLTTGLYPRRQDEEVAPPDSATISPHPASGFRTVKDDCAWLISPDGIEDWRLTLTYTAYIESYDDTSVRARSKRLMDSTEQKYVETLGSDYKSSGKSTWGDAATVFYVPGDGSSKSEYTVIMRSKGVVCELSFQPTASDVDVSKTSFRVEADPAATTLAQEIHYLLPD